ncbi:hypothetical protein GOY17_01765 [Lysobacter soli]|uniref:hypothetical protein n=1 Tax=Lysobacter soli TaxID=453783 RepID=UPI0012ECF8C3|nr:hypothetical protein [Lysobacter soli]QGW63753.1 hypothetical protein GOY17_01765 [Lysobacter soli]
MTKWTFAASIALLVAACSHGRMDPRKSVLVEVSVQRCLDTLRNDEIPLVITNRSDRQVAFFSTGTSGPPYVLHPYAFAINFAEPRSDDELGVLLEHYIPPKNEVRLDPGDRAEVLAYASLWPLPGYTGRVRAEVTDTNGRPYVSEELAVCVSTAMSASGR